MAFCISVWHCVCKKKERCGSLSNLSHIQYKTKSCLKKYVIVLFVIKVSVTVLNKGGNWVTSCPNAFGREIFFLQENYCVQSVWSEPCNWNNNPNRQNVGRETFLALIRSRTTEQLDIASTTLHKRGPGGRRRGEYKNKYKCHGVKTDSGPT